MVNKKSNFIKKQKRYVTQMVLLTGIVFCYLIKTCPAIAQITSDNTLTTPTQVLPGVQPGLDFDITNGTQIGNNLFHSFREFSVPTGGSANFNNLTSIENIISRVTGGFVSNIDGLIKTNGNANLFLINPNGIIFGPNASLNVGGSFIGTTASSLKLSNGDEFSATNPKTPLLTISVPLGLQFNNAPQPIINQSQSDGGLGLQGSPNTTLALLGGEVIGDFGNITVPGGRIELGSVGNNSFVGITPTSQGFAFNYADINNFGNVQLNGSVLDVSRPSGGNIQIQGQTVTLFNQSALFAVNTFTGSQNSSEIAVRGNQINVNDSAIQTITFSKKAGGNITLTAQQINIQGSAAFVAAETKDVGKGGNLTITADDLQITDLSIVGTESSASGLGGDIIINTNTLTLNNGAQITANARAKGAGGNLTIKALNSIDLSGEGEIDGEVYTSNLSVETSGSGQTGLVDIETAKLTIRDGAIVSASTFANGTAGNVFIKATGAELNGTSASLNTPSGIFSQVKKDATGKGGNIVFKGQHLDIQGGAQLATTTFSSGNAGSIDVKADNLIKIRGQDSGLFAQVENSATGKGGNVFIQTNNLALEGGQALISASTLGSGIGGSVDIKTQDLLVQDGGQIQAATLGFAPGGKLDVTATNTIQLIGTSAVDQSPGGLFTSTKGDAPAGDIIIKTGNLSILNGARVSASSFGAGEGGNVNIDRANQVQLIGTSANGQARSGLFVQGTGTGKAGNIQLQSRSLLLDQRGEILAETGSDDGGNISLKVADVLQMRRNSLISANAGTTSGKGNGGNIDINTTFVVAVPSENSDITANAVKGRGGNIDITAKYIFGLELRDQLTPFSDITVSSTYGIQGNAEFKDINTQTIQGFVSLPITFIDASKAIARGCSSNKNQAVNKFIIVGRGGLPASPESVIGGDFILEDLATNPLPGKTNSIGTNISPTITTSTSKAIVQAQAIVVNSEGKIFLVAEVPTNTNPISWLSSDCYAL